MRDISDNDSGIGGVALVAQGSCCWLVWDVGCLWVVCGATVAGQVLVAACMCGHRLDNAGSECRDQCVVGGLGCQ
jgi:hypothetical protein